MPSPLSSSELEITVTDPLQDQSVSQVETGQFVRLTVRPTGTVSDDSKFNNLASVRIQWIIYPQGQQPPQGQRIPPDRTDAAPLHAWGTSGTKTVHAFIIYRFPGDGRNQERTVDVSTDVAVKGADYSKRFSSIIEEQSQDQKPAAFQAARQLHEEYVQTLKDFGGEKGWKYAKAKRGEDRIESKIKLWDEVHQNFAVTYTSGSVGFTPEELWRALGIDDFSTVFSDEYRSELRPADETTAYNGFITVADGEHWKNQFANEIPFSSAQRQVWRDLGFGRIEGSGDTKTAHTVVPSTSNLGTTRTENIKDSFVEECFGTKNPSKDAIPEKHEFFWLGRQLLAHRFDMESKARDLVAFLKYGTPALAGITLAGPGHNTPSPPTGKLHPANTETCVRTYSELQKPGSFKPVLNTREWQCHLLTTERQSFEKSPIISIGGAPGPEVVVGNDFLAELKSVPYSIQMEVLSQVLPGLSATDVGRKYLVDSFKHRNHGGMIDPLHVLNPPTLSSQSKLERTGENYICATSGQRQQVFSGGAHTGQVTSDRVLRHLERIVPELLVGSSLYYAEAIQSDLDETVSARFNGMVREAFTRSVPQANADYHSLINDENLTEPVTAVKNHGPRNYGGQASDYGFDDYAEIVGTVQDISQEVIDGTKHAKKAKYGEDWSSSTVSGFDAALSGADVFISLTTFVHDVSTSGSLSGALGEIAQFAGTQWHSLALSTYSIVDVTDQLSSQFDATQYFGRFAGDDVGIYLGGVGVMYSIINYVGLLYSNAETDVTVLNGFVLGMDIILFGLEAWAHFSSAASVGGPVLVGAVVVATIVGLVGAYFYNHWKDTDVENWIQETVFGTNWDTGEYRNPDEVEWWFKSNDTANFGVQSLKYGSIVNSMNFEPTSFPKVVSHYSTWRWTFSPQLNPDDGIRQGGALFLRPIIAVPGNQGYAEVRALPWLHRIYLSEHQSEIRSKSRTPIYPRLLASKLQRASSSMERLARHQLAFGNWINGHMSSQRGYDPSVAETIAGHAATAANEGKTITSKYPNRYAQQPSLPFWQQDERDSFNPKGDPEHDWDNRIGSTSIQNPITVKADTPETTPTTNDQGRLDSFKPQLVPQTNAAGVFGARQLNPGGSAPQGFGITHWEAVYVPASSFVELRKQNIDVNTMAVPFTLGSRWELYKS